MLAGGWVDGETACEHYKPHGQSRSPGRYFCVEFSNYRDFIFIFIFKGCGKEIQTTAVLFPV